MTKSKQLAALIGPTVMVLAASEAMNLRIWAVNIAPITYLNGTILFVAGLAIIRVHNYWGPRWPVMVTLTGWFALLIGLYRMFAPQAQQAGQNFATYVLLAVLFVMGAFLAFKGYSRKEG
ncbi:hypothetical protein [Candidatus Ferrigenium straubiae]|jgi:cation transport ATPase|uniref:hypothetical protein n=1 Tax=Candidatus Ferrigenium straubiae TaxID=2919506 RepID=UPI003F4AA17B